MIYKCEEYMTKIDYDEIISEMESSLGKIFVGEGERVTFTPRNKSTDTFMMIDFETLSLKSPIVLEIGVVVFDTLGIKEEILIKVCPKSCQDVGLNLDINTVSWWLNENKELLSEKVNARDALSIEEAIALLFKTYREWCCTKVVGNGSLADILWVHQIVDKLKENTSFKEEIPWSFRDEMCFRTLKALLPPVNVEFEGIRHDALDDARWQSLYMIEVLKNIGENNV